MSRARWRKDNLRILTGRIGGYQGQLSVEEEHLPWLESGTENIFYASCGPKVSQEKQQNLTWAREWEENEIMTLMNVVRLDISFFIIHSGIIDELYSRAHVHTLCASVLVEPNLRRHRPGVDCAFEVQKV